MIGCLWTRVLKQPIIVLYFESEAVLKFYNLEASKYHLYFEYQALNITILVYNGSTTRGHFALHFMIGESCWDKTTLITYTAF